MVQLRDGGGAPVSQAGIPVSAALGAGSGTLSGTRQQNTDANGRAVFTDLAINGSAGRYTLVFSSAGYASATSTDYVRPENQRAAANLREDFRHMTMADLERQAETMPMGTANEVAERIIAATDSAGANQVQLAINRGALPHDLFMAQIERFAREVLPRLQAHEVKTVPAAEEALA